MSDNVIVNCPHCDLLIFVYLKEFNCRIFRHGIYKATLKQIDPHLPKIDCDRLKTNDEIIGCGKPFEIIDISNTQIAVSCDYI